MSKDGLYTIKRIVQLYGSTVARSSIISAEKNGLIPTPERRKSGSIASRVWTTAILPKVGARYGFLAKPTRPKCITVFSAKGGVLKTSLAFNIARMAALHNIKTCVLGLDLQGDITNALGLHAHLQDTQNMQSALEEIRRVRGLGAILSRRSSLADVIRATDIPTLSFIPETAELISLDRSISTKERREYILRDVVVKRLKREFDLIIIDCSPNWNHLISNAMVACDVLISPVECKINQFNNLQVFQELIREFKRHMKLRFEHVYIPTRFTPTRRLSNEIRLWYMANVSGTTNAAIRECALGEEAMAAHLSLPEHSPASPYADEMRDLLKEMWTEIIAADNDSVARMSA